MNKKRYAIVRVDKDCNKCELGYKQRNGKTSCRLQWFKGFNCDNYGDTKEQLIKKVQQALFKSIFNDNVQKAISVEEQKRIYKGYRPMAEKIVEFLGVKE